MNAQQTAAVKVNMEILTNSMMRRTPITITGNLTSKSGVQHGRQTIHDVVNGVQVEDGSGKNYIVNFKSGAKMFVRLA
jgi:hypothetical protein